MDIEAQLNSLKQSLAHHDYTLVAVSKTKPNEAIQAAYNAGQQHFGENKVQELAAKYEALPKDIQWHMIGHLQRNKVKYIAPFVHLIHSVDSLRLLQEINKQAQKAGRTIGCLLQVHIAAEETKFGFDAAELEALICGPEVAQLPYISLKGLMGMATNTSNVEQVRQEFKGLAQTFEALKPLARQVQQWQPNVLSMGMSGDYAVALEEGSNMIRVGSKIFGAR